MLATVRIVIIAAALGAILTGCAGQPARQTARKADGGNTHAPRESMIVPDQDSALAQSLRQALAERGWHLIGYSKDMTSGHADYQAMARRAKYRLTLLGTPVGRCRNGDSSFLYRIAIIQNSGGDVPVALSGAACLAPIVREFGSDLDQKQLAPIPRHSTSTAKDEAQ